MKVPGVGEPGRLLRRFRRSSGITDKQTALKSKLRNQPIVPTSSEPERKPSHRARTNQIDFRKRPANIETAPVMPLASDVLFI